LVVLVEEALVVAAQVVGGRSSSDTKAQRHEESKIFRYIQPFELIERKG